MPKRFSENRYLADLYTKDQVQAVFMQDLIDRIDNVAKQAGVAMAGDLTPPPPVNAINVKASGEMVHVTLTHGAELTRPIQYHIEADTNPNFPAPHLVAQSSSRSHFFVLPGFNDTGVQQNWYVRAFAQYPGSQPSQPIVFGGLANPTPIVLKGGAGGTKLTPLGSTGSGTSSTTGQQGGQGFGKFRTSTPKAVRLGKQQAANQPTQIAVQPGGQPVIIFTPQPNGNTPPVVVVDQSGNNGIDFSGGTPISKRLTANGVAFADTSGNLILKNVAQASGGNGTTTNSAVYSTVSGVTVTFTTKGNSVLITASMTVLFTQGATAEFAIFRDGTQVSGDYIILGAINAETTVTLAYIDSPTAASHTYDLRWKSITSTTITAEGAPAIQAVELG